MRHRSGEHRRPRILIVHDELPKLAAALTIVEHDRRYQISIAEGGYDALHRARAAAAPFDVVCTAASMRDLDGRSLLHRLSSMRTGPWAAILVTSDRDAVLPPREDGGPTIAVVREPYRPEQLRDAIDRAATSVELRRVLVRATHATNRIDSRRRTG